MTDATAWPVGIVGVVQAPFNDDKTLDVPSLERLVHDALEAGVDGLLAPGLASEAAFMTADERLDFARRVHQLANGSVPVFWGAGYGSAEGCIAMAEQARRMDAAGILVIVPAELYETPENILPYFDDLAKRTQLPLMIQDWDPGGGGMSVEQIVEMFEKVDLFRYIKIETLPAGPKYTAVLEATDGKLHVSGGWAVPQMVEALDRGVHAMIPECSMIRIYKKIDMLHRSGHREEAQRIFNQLLPVLAFTNQNLETSIRFFKRLLRAKGIFSTTRDRLRGDGFDATSERTCNELIQRVLEIERSGFDA